MENFVTSLNAITPMFAIIALGYLVRLKGMLGEEELAHFNAVVFRVFLSCLMFESIYTSDISGSFKPKLILYAFSCIAVTFVLAVLFVLHYTKEAPKRGVMIQGIFRSNFVLLGLPLTICLCGKENAGVAAVLIAVVVPTFNVLAVIILETFHGGTPGIKKVFLGILKNPLIIGAALGILAKALHLTLPSAAAQVVSELSDAATPIALFILGGSFQFKSARANWREVAISLCGKLVIIPAAVLLLALALGFRGVEFVVLLGIFAAPTAATSFTMAQQMGGDASLAADIVVMGTAASSITMLLWVFLFKQLGIF